MLSLPVTRKLNMHHKAHDERVNDTLCYDPVACANAAAADIVFLLFPSIAHSASLLVASLFLLEICGH